MAAFQQPQGDIIVQKDPVSMYFVLIIGCGCWSGPGVCGGGSSRFAHSATDGTDHRASDIRG